jgi:hypothetical protein
MPQQDKNIIFPFGTTGLSDIVFRVQRDRDDYELDNDDGVFKDTPTDADIPAVEDPDNDGVYFHNEGRVDWEFENDMYNVFAYQAGTLIGEGKLKLHYGRGSVTVKPISAGGGAPLPVGASTSANQATMIAALGGSPNYYSNDTGGEPTTSSTTFAGFATISFGFTTRGITLQNTSDENLDFSWDGSTVHKTLEPGDELTIPVAITQLDVKSASGGKTFKVTAV